MVSAVSDALVPPTAGARAVDEFLDVVLGDAELLAAEFEAIIENAWGGEPEGARPEVRRGPGDGAASHPGTPIPAEPVRGPAHPPQPRVRSPPTEVAAEAAGPQLTRATRPPACPGGVGRPRRRCR